MADKMPARSVVEQLTATRRLDKIAIPLIPAFGIEAAYVHAIEVVCRESQPQRKPRRAGAQGSLFSVE